MQDKTIDSALLVLREQGGKEAKLAEVLLELRGVHMPPIRKQVFPMRRGELQRIMLQALRDGPQDTAQLAQRLKAVRPTITHRQANNRTYQSMLRLGEKGLVRRDGRLWGLAQ